jgi:hypothetical protein
VLLDAGTAEITISSAWRGYWSRSRGSDANQAARPRGRAQSNRGLAQLLFSLALTKITPALWMLLAALGKAEVFWRGARSPRASAAPASDDTERLRAARRLHHSSALVAKFVDPLHQEGCLSRYMRFAGPCYAPSWSLREPSSIGALGRPLALVVRCWRNGRKGPILACRRTIPGTHRCTRACWGG